MADRLIKDHRSLGEEVEYSETHKGVSKQVRGVITGVRRPHSQLLWNMKTGTITPQKNLVQLRIKPNDGGRVFWTPTMRDNAEAAGNAEPVETGLATHQPTPMTTKAETKMSKNDSGGTTESGVLLMVSYIASLLFAVNYGKSFGSWRGWFVAIAFSAAVASIRRAIKETKGGE